MDKAQEHENKEYYYRQWLVHLPKMTKETFVTFEDYYLERQRPKFDLRSKDELMADILGS